MLLNLLMWRWMVRLHAAGAVLIAKLATGEMAYDDVWWGGKVKNPWNIAEVGCHATGSLLLLLYGGSNPEKVSIAASDGCFWI